MLREYPPERTSWLPASHPRSSPRALCLLHPDVSARAGWLHEGLHAAELAAGLAEHTSEHHSDRTEFGVGRRSSPPTCNLHLARDTASLLAWLEQRQLAGGLSGGLNARLEFRLAALALTDFAPRLDPTLEMPLAEQQWLIDLWSCGDRLTHFERLGLAPTRDAAAIRRAFLGTCQRLHPDRYYGKHIGRFARVLVDLFHRAHAAHVAIADPRSCGRYLAQLAAAGHTIPADEEPSTQPQR